MHLIKYSWRQVLNSYMFRHRGAIFKVNCNSLSAFAGWCISCKNVHGMCNTDWCWTFCLHYRPQFPCSAKLCISSLKPVSKYHWHSPAVLQFTWFISRYLSFRTCVPLSCNWRSPIINIIAPAFRRIVCSSDFALFFELIILEFT